MVSRGGWVYSPGEMAEWGKWGGKLSRQLPFCYFVYSPVRKSLAISLPHSPLGPPRPFSDFAQ